MLILRINDFEGNFIKEWQWLGHRPVPSIGDTVVINDEGAEATVLHRYFSDADANVLVLGTDYVKDIK